MSQIKPWIKPLPAVLPHLWLAWEVRCLSALSGLGQMLSDYPSLAVSTPAYLFSRDNRHVGYHCLNTCIGEIQCCIAQIVTFLHFLSLDIRPRPWKFNFVFSAVKFAPGWAILGITFWTGCWLPCWLLLLWITGTVDPGHLFGINNHLIIACIGEMQCCVVHLQPHGCFKWNFNIVSRKFIVVFLETSLNLGHLHRTGPAS